MYPASRTSLNAKNQLIEKGRTMSTPPLKVVYIAGPYGDKGGYHAIERNIAQAREAAAWCAENGYGYYCPHLNSAHFEVITPSVPVEFWYAMDLRFIEVSDFMLVLPGWQNSRGTQAEMKACEAAGKVWWLWEDREHIKEDIEVVLGAE